MKKLMILFVSLLLLTTLASCGEKRETYQKTAARGKVLATVNGVPITEQDLKQITQSLAERGESLSPEITENGLQTLVRDELIYQKALQLGLDKDPGYRQRLSDVELRVHSFQRREMLTLFRRYVQEKAGVTEAEAQEYFDKNAKNFQTKYHLLQLFYKGNDESIAKDLKDLKSGMPFEKVAARRLPGLSKNAKPWDRGYVFGNQMPPSWLGVVDGLEPGQVSDIIKAGNDRFWVIKLVDKTVDPQITFTTTKEKIIDALRKQKAEALFNSTLAEVKEKANIDYIK